MRRHTTESFIIAAIKKHNDEYDYSKSVYLRDKAKTVIICKEHGEFKQSVGNHLQGQGCPTCGITKRKNARILGIDQFIEHAVQIHGQTYDYSKFVYIDGKTPGVIICPVHGEFEKKPTSHVSKKSGCPKCTKGSCRRHTTESFIIAASKKHNNEYDYSKSEYLGDKCKTAIICKYHGEFMQVPSNHLQGQGCPGCKVGKIKKAQRLGIDGFIDRAMQIHGQKYDYSEFVYINGKTPGIISCPIHGKFEKTPISHLNKKRGCAECTPGYYAKRTTEDFVTLAKQAHGDRYKYDTVSYSGASNKVEITCDKHGVFQQTAHDHIAGRGCPNCSNVVSAAHQDILDYLKSLGTIVTVNNRSIISPLELDIYIEDARLGIEYCGLYWHSEARLGKNYHYNKLEKCKDAGISLITVFEDEWIERKPQVLDIIKHRLMMNNQTIGARNFTVSEISNSKAIKFLDENHISGGRNSKVRIGAFYDDRLLGVMMLSAPNRQSGYQWELNRFATNGVYPGLGNKMYTYFIRNYHPTSVVSFSDSRYFTGALYPKLGFQHDGVIRPDYSYFKSKKRFHKSAMRKEKMRLKFGISIEGKTEPQIATELGFEKIWDCGKTRWVWNAENNK